MKKLGEAGQERNKFRESFPNISVLMGSTIVFLFGLWFFPSLLEKTAELPDFSLPGWTEFVFNLPAVLWAVLSGVFVAGSLGEILAYQAGGGAEGGRRRWALAPLIGGLVLVLAVQASAFVFLTAMFL